MRQFCGRLMLLGGFILLSNGILFGQIQMRLQIQEQQGKIIVTPAKVEEPKKAEAEKKTAPPVSDLTPVDQKKLDQETLKASAIEDNGPAIIQFLNQRSLPATEQAKVVDLIQKLGSDDFEVREVASETLLKYGISILGMLRQAERSPDAEIARRCQQCILKIEKQPIASTSTSAIRRLAELKPAETVETLLRFLTQTDDETQVQEITKTLAAVSMKGDKPDALLVQALVHPNDMIRGVASEAFALGGNDAVRMQVRKLAAQETNMNNRVTVLLSLARYSKDKLAIDQLLENLTLLPEDQLWKVEEFIAALQPEGANPIQLGGDATSRTKGITEANEWWKTNREKVDLARLEETPKLLGFTIVMELDNRGLGGRVIELDQAGKERWKITGVQFPADAQLLPGNRILVAEHNGSKISERDFNGKEYWSYNINQPIHVSRLNNGNIFVVTRTQVMELRRDGMNVKTLFTYNRPQFDISTGKRLRNGDFCIITTTGMLVLLDKTGKQIRTFNVGPVNYWSGIEQLSNDKILITQRTALTEIDLQSGGRGFTVPYMGASSVQRLPNGHYLVTGQNRALVSEIDRTGKSVWEYQSQDPNFRPWRAFRR